MGVCCVDGCEADDKEDVAYFPVPVAPAQLRKWRDAIRPTVKLHQDSKICSKHFNKSEYEKVRGKYRLKGRVVPSVFDKIESTLSVPSQETNGADTRNGRKSKDGGKRKDCAEIKDGAENKDGSENKDGAENKDSSENKDGCVNKDGAENKDGCENKDGGEIKDGAESNNDEESREKGEESEEEDGSMDVNVEMSDLLQTELHEDVEDQGCTIECVPEAILPEESDSETETELNKEDIEDIIANYHIQQHSKLNNSYGKLNNTDTKERETGGGTETENIDSKEKQNTCEENQETSKNQLPPDKQTNKDKQSNITNLDDDDDDDDDLIEVGVEHRPKFVEISVDAGRSDGAAPGSEPATDDCMMLLENVQVDIDPTALMLAQQQDESDDDVVMETTRKEDPISLLTSSDESDVIFEEPHIDTVEVSSEDEDDKPLVALVKRKTKPTKLTRMLWGNLTEYYCYQCKFTTLSKTESERHKLQHSTSTNSKILFVCEVCNFTCASKSVFSKHKKRHREEKRYKCKYCEYRARHSMSLVYHLKSHQEVTGTIDVDDITIEDIKDKYKCSDCRFVTSSRKEIIRHAESCDRGQGKVKVRMTTHFCNLCKYSTKRKSDLRRHRERKHLNEFDDYD
ncbi:hypothetical protein O0L34_g11970 [Tuta absoluta]|nr:hypothetical protein O0L34_g11970 [Tuta absoluta]